MYAAIHDVLPNVARRHTCQVSQQLNTVLPTPRMHGGASGRLPSTLRRLRIILRKHRHDPIPFIIILIRRRRAAATKKVGQFRNLVRRREGRETQGVGLVPRDQVLTRVGWRPQLRLRLGIWSLLG